MGGSTRSSTTTPCGRSSASGSLWQTALWNEGHCVQMLHVDIEFDRDAAVGLPIILLRRPLKRRRPRSEVIQAILAECRPSGQHMALQLRLLLRAARQLAR